MNEIIKKVKYDESYESDYYETVTHYFIAPVELLDVWLRKNYEDAVSAEISIEVLLNCQEVSEACVSISPTRDEGGCLTDYDWTNIQVAPEEAEYLLNIAKKEYGEIRKW